MSKRIFFLLLVLTTFDVQGQVKPPLAINDFREGLNPLDEIRLFDLNEIRSRKIDTVYIIYHPASWIEDDLKGKPCNCSYNDTIASYVFDKKGRIIEKSSINNVLGYASTAHYDTNGNRKAWTDHKRVDGIWKSSTRILNILDDSFSFKQIFIRGKDGKDSLITTITFLKFKNGLDTATIKIERYNERNILIETQQSINKKNEREYDDDTGSETFHYKYDYDEIGRLIYYRDFETREYEKISYPFYGKLTEIYNSLNDNLIERKVKLIKKDKEILTITLDGKQITLTPLEKGSKSYKLVTIVEANTFPYLYYHEIVYIGNK